MPNYLRSVEARFEKIKKLLEETALELEKSGAEGQVKVVQNLKVSGEMAEVFRDKPIVIIQSASVKFVKINNQVQMALRLLNEIDIRLYREAMLRTLGVIKRDKTEPKKIGTGSTPELS